MIVKVSLNHFKKFKNKMVELQPLSILVGENSSGKTTILQAINLSLNALSAGKLVSHYGKVRESGISVLSLPGINIADFRELYYAKKSRGVKGDPRMGTTVTLEDNLGNLYKLQTSSMYGGYNIKCLSKSDDLKNSPILHSFVPLFISGFVGLQGSEERSFPLVIKRQLSSGLVSSIIRNLVLELKMTTPQNYSLLCERMKKDFGFYLADVEFNESNDEYVTASYYEECESKRLTMDFNSSGSGYMQILQILAPIYSVCPDQCRIVMLDEPDAHLHPNMQIALAKSLMRIQRELGVQIIISTHSPSIIQSVSPTSIIPITSSGDASTSLSSNKEVHDFISQIDNYELAKSVISGKMVFFEDANTDILEAIDGIINTKVFSGLNTSSIHRAKGKDDKLPFQVRELLETYLDKDVEIHFVRDRDGLDDGWCDKLTEYAKSHNVVLHILNRYEMENYLLSSSLIRRAIQIKHPDATSLPTEEEIQSKIIEFIKNTITFNRYGYDTTLEDCIFKTALLLKDDIYRNKNDMTAEVKRIRSAYEKYADYDSLIQVGMGKEARSQLLNWLNSEKKLKMEKQDLVDAIQSEDIPTELSELLNSLRSVQGAVDDFSLLEDATTEDDTLMPDNESAGQLTMW